MNTEQRVKFEELLTKSCDEVLKQGKKIMSGIFGNGGYFCPIGAVAHINPLADRYTIGSYSGVLSSVLGFEVSSAEMWAFADGFDNGSCPTNHPEVYALGLRFRNKYIKSDVADK